jgi:hypothetical protein
LKKKYLSLALGGVLLSALILLLHSRSQAHLSDPDRLYHFAVSREMKASGELFLKTLPQVEDLGWGSYYSDKEFFYHQLTGLAYRLAGDAGVIYLTLACTIIALLTLFLHAASSLPVGVALVSSLTIFGIPYFTHRMLLVRPHCLAVLLFLLLNIFLLRKKTWAVGVSCFLFALSYHAFYVPLACLGLFYCANLFGGGKEARESLKISLAGATGIAVGLLVNPYFPSNIISAWEIARIPGLMQGELAITKFGNELYPMPANTLLQFFFLPLGIFVLGLLFLGNTVSRKLRRLEFEWRFFYLVPLCLFFLILAFKSPRATEYLVPAAGLLLVLLLEQVRPWRMLAYGIFTLVSGVFALVAAGEFADSLKLPPRPWALQAEHTLGFLPRGAKVYNCEWDSTPALLYYRPDLRFVDILDPSLLYFSRRDKFRVREALGRGEVPDMHGMLRKVFSADYVLCAHGSIVAQMDSDPSFRRVHPSRTHAMSLSYSLPNIYEIRRDDVPNYVREFSVKSIAGATAENYRSLSPLVAKASEGKSAVLEKSTYLNLFSLLRPTPSKLPGATQCAFLSPAPKEMERLAGGEYLVLGGGRNLRLWVNGKPLYASRSAFLWAQDAQIMVPLEKPLAPSDKVEILVCSLETAPYWGTALSVWKEPELKKLCAWKWEKDPAAEGDFGWKYLGEMSRTCLAPMAVPIPKAGIGTF